MGQIYCIRNIVNGKCYVGQTVKGFTIRYKGGKWWKYTSNPVLLNAVSKYGVDVFHVSILNFSNDINELNLLEQYWAEVLDSYHPNGYNLRGCGGNKKISEHTLEAHVYRAVLCSNGNIYKSIKDAAESLNLSKSDISSHLAGRLPHVKGYSFSDADREPPVVVVKRDTSVGRQRVYCSNGHSYGNYRVAAEDLGMHRDQVLRCLKGLQKYANGFVFSFDPDDKLELIKTKYETKTRVRLSNGMVFESVKEAASYLGVNRASVQKALQNGTKCCKFNIYRCQNDSGL